MALKILKNPQGFEIPAPRCCATDLATDAEPPGFVQHLACCHNMQPQRLSGCSG